MYNKRQPSPLQSSKASISDEHFGFITLPYLCNLERLYELWLKYFASKFQELAIQSGSRLNIWANSYEYKRVNLRVDL